MTTHSNVPDHDDLQWQAQERARLAVRDGCADADPADVRVARALRHAPAIALPTDFATTVARSAAAQVAGLAREQARSQETDNALLEQHLLRGLSMLFVLSALVTVAWFGRSWPADLAAALPGGNEAVRWSAVTALCVLVNWSWGLLRRQFEASRHTPA